VREFNFEPLNLRVMVLLPFNTFQNMFSLHAITAVLILSICGFLLDSLKQINRVE